MTALININMDAFGVEPIRAVLSEHSIKIAPRTYHARKSRTPAARTVRDTGIGVSGRDVGDWRVFHDRELGRGLAGARKARLLLQREGAQERFEPIACCTVERLMRDMGLQGMRRGPKRVRTTIADGMAERPADLVGWDFTAPAPNRFSVVDFTYDRGRLEGLVQHSGAGSQYVAFPYTE